MKLSSDFLTHNSKGEHITVSTNNTKFNGLIRSNPTAAFIIECLKSDTTQEKILEEVLEKYDIDRETADKDISNLLNTLRKVGAIDE